MDAFDSYVAAHKATAVAVSTERERLEATREAIRQGAAVVDSWPPWKQQALASGGTAVNKNQREPVLDSPMLDPYVESAAVDAADDDNIDFYDMLIRATTPTQEHTQNG